MLQRGTLAACFSEQICSPIMWSHYANEHTGFALEYTFPRDFFCLSPFFDGESEGEIQGFGWRSLLPVAYTESRLDGTELAEWFCLCTMNDRLFEGKK